jgi:hypothetical protein
MTVSISIPTLPQLPREWLETNPRVLTLKAVIHQKSFSPNRTNNFSSLSLSFFFVVIHAQKSSVTLEFALSINMILSDAIDTVVCLILQSKKNETSQYFLRVSVRPYLSSVLSRTPFKFESSASVAPASPSPNPKMDFSDVVLFEKLGSGGSGASVYRCSANGFTCAVKIMNTSEIMSEILDNFLKEIKILESVDHPNIIR